jgi:serine/threonine protein kinase
LKEETGLCKIYMGENNNLKRLCILKIINKNHLKQLDYDLIMKQLEREEEYTKLCKSKNIVNFYRKLETEENIIFELEYCDNNLKEYLYENGSLERKKALFKNIVQSVVKAIENYHKKGIMHRDIKPNNIFIVKEDDQDEDKEIKLGDFGCSVLIKENNSEKMGSLFYSAPEILQDLKYDERCDLWSLGVTLFELYFGVLPYGNQPDENIILDMIDDENNFIFRKSGIANLDILFKCLLAIDPNKRMTFQELFEYVSNDNFMNKNVIFLNNNNKYKQIYEIIQKERQIDYPELIIQEADNPEEKEKQSKETMVKVANGGKFPDIMNIPNGSTNSEEKFNNIIYYDENTDYIKNINTDSDSFERHTSGAFILCTDMNSLKLIRDEILIQIKKDSRTTFNMITTGSKCEQIINFIKEKPEFEKCIKRVCVFCWNLTKWSYLKDKYPIIDGVYKKRKEVNINFIEKYASKDIKAFPLTKLITYNEYLNKYKDRHFKISQFYGDLTPESYKENIKKMDLLIDEEDKNKQLKKEKDIVHNGFVTFDINKDAETLHNLIIREYTNNSFYGDLNKWLMNSKFNSYDTIAYFTARLMYSLNSYGETNKMYFNESKNVLRGIKVPYSSLLPYERAIGKVILLSSFTSTSQSEKAARNFSGRKRAGDQYKNNLLFSVIYIIKNCYEKDWVSNGINIMQESHYKKEQEILYQPFSFYFVKDVKINKENYTADIYLETIGKTEILEEELKAGKIIEFNPNKKIMQVKE